MPKKDKDGDTKDENKDDEKNSGSNKKDRDKSKKNSKTKTTGATVAVWSFRTGKEVKQIKVGRDTVDFVEFAAPDQLVTGDTAGKSFQISRIESGEQLGEIRTPWPVARQSLASAQGAGIWR